MTNLFSGQEPVAAHENGMEEGRGGLRCPQFFNRIAEEFVLV
jgi:hypothetical protein